jgi:phosphonate transport system substrate-binding protein
MDDIGSTSGHLCPSQLLADYGLEPKLDDVDDRPTRARAVAHEALKRGDVAAIGVNYTSWVNGVRAKDDSRPAGQPSGSSPARATCRATSWSPAPTWIPAVSRDAIQHARWSRTRPQGHRRVDPLGRVATTRSIAGMDLVAIDDKAPMRPGARSMYATIGQPQYLGVRRRMSRRAGSFDDPCPR